MKLPSKKGQVSSLVPAVIAFVIVGLVIVIGSNINTDIQSDQVVGSGAYNATLQVGESLTTLGSWLPTIALVIAAAVVIGAVMFLKGKD